MPFCLILSDFNSILQCITQQCRADLPPLTTFHFFCQAALLKGYEPFIVTWHEEILENSSLPLKPQNEIEPYSDGITVLRPSAVGNYKLLDGRYNMGMVAAVVEIAQSDPTMEMTLMCLYLQPHAQICLDAVDAIRGAWGDDFDVTSVAEAVGSDVTNILSNALKEENFGAAIAVLSQFLRFDVPVCVSQVGLLTVNSNGPLFEPSKCYFIRNLALLPLLCVRLYSLRISRCPQTASFCCLRPVYA